MREIRFRAKRKADGKWVEGNLFIPDIETAETETAETEICIGTPTVRITYAVIPETVGQYTGLTDKNGNKIFEGDVIEQSGCRWVVGFQNNAFVALEEDGSMQFALFEQYIFDWDEKTWIPPDYFEVIGNIHDNPELLEVGE